MSLLVTYIRISVPRRQNDSASLAVIGGIYVQSDDAMKAHRLVKIWNEMAKGCNDWIYRVIRIEPADIPRQFAVIVEDDIAYCMANDRKFPHPSELTAEYELAQDLLAELQRTSAEIGRAILTAEQVVRMEQEDPVLALALHRMVATVMSARLLYLEDMVQALQLH